MTDWQARALTPAEAVRLVRSGQHVFLHGGCAAALPLEAALAERARELEGVTVYQMDKEGPEVLADPELAGHVRIRAFFLGAELRRAVAEDRADYLPVFLSDIPRFMRDGVFPIDVAVVQLSPPNAHGYCTLGTSLDVARQAVASARVVIAEINRQMPRTEGDTAVHLDELDAFVVTDRPVIEHRSPAITPEARAIGEQVAALVSDGATLQVGIGAIPDAVLAALHDKQDLGLHTEMFSDGVMTLVRAGVITNRRKALYTGKCVTSFVIGTRALYDFVDDCPDVLFFPSDVTNDTHLIRQHDDMVAINGALQVDWSGQVCADSIGPAIYSGIGGQMDFMRGAALARRGKAVIALPSTACHGTVSRIVPMLSPGAGVVTTRGHVHYVVTEYGTADLRGCTLNERAERLIAIAHPDHRGELRAQLAARRHVAPGGI
ncbi:MAG TPA: acetyl-CoA hydrolase/transferase C-terminal domain-containing protein [Oscillatoriaceae cyanobacterium]